MPRGLATTDRRCRPGIVHIGLGAFARAHLAVYIDDLLAAGHHDLGIIGVSLHHDDTKRALEPQDWLYTLGVVDGNDMRHRIIGSITPSSTPRPQPAEVRTALATMPLVTVTVTEKGYCWNPVDPKPRHRRCPTCATTSSTRTSPERFLAISCSPLATGATTAGRR